VFKKFYVPLLSNDLSFISDRFFKSHSHNLPSWLLLLLVGIFSCTLPSIPRAQSTPLTNPAEIAAQEQLRQQERERVQRQQQEVRPDVRLRTSQNFIDDTEVRVQRRRTAGWELGLNHREFFGSSTLDLSVNQRQGTGAFGARHAPEELFDEGTSRMRLTTTDMQLTIPFNAANQSLR